MDTQIPVAIYAEVTPNPLTMKFVANQMLWDGEPIELENGQDASETPLLARILNFPFVEKVFMVANFITVTRNDVIEWDMVQLELREFIQDYIRQGNPIVNPGYVVSSNKVEVSDEVPEGVEVNVAKTDDDQKIMDVLNEYIQPAVAQDGGAIDFVSYKEGVVTVLMRGACNGCPSSTQTLKAGVENLLKEMVPGVKEVVAH